MSGDVQPRKRKDKRRKKEDLPGSEDVGSSNVSSDENIHVHSDKGTGGNICAKIVFFMLLGALAVMVGLILTEYRGSEDVDTPIAESRWAQVFDGFIDESPEKHDEHDEHVEEHDDEHSEEEHGHEHDELDEHADHDEHEEEDHEAVSEEEEEQASEEEEEEEKSEEGADEEEEEEEDQEASEEELEDIPGVTESAEDDDEGEDESAGDEDEEEDDDDEQGVSEEAGGEKSEEQLEQEDDDDDDDDEDENGDDDDDDVEEVGKAEAEESEAADQATADAGEEDDDDDDDEEPSGATKPLTPEESGEEEESEEEDEEEDNVPPSRGSKSTGGQVYKNADITSDDDFKIYEDLDFADDDLDQKPEAAMLKFTEILTKHPNSPRAQYGKARSLDQLAEKKQSNSLLQDAIDAYENLLAFGAVVPDKVPDKLFLLAADRCINRMRFKGQHHKAIHIHKKLIHRFSEDPAHTNQLAVTYLMVNRLTDAKRLLEDTLHRWPNNGFAQVHYGFILKTGDNNNEAAVDYLTRGIATREPGTIDGRFFFQLGDALTRLGRQEEAGTIHDLGVREGLFLSKYQRSLYNVDRLTAQPWWTPEQTTYLKHFKKLEENWQKIRTEGLTVLADKMFKDEAENLKDVGNWKQFELFARGRKIHANCGKAPVTCQLISEFPAAHDCRRGQVKFSVMHAGTHVWPHCGPTNCRLRSHLGLVVPQGTYIRVAEETRTWKEGKLFIFDDSFEHEVWHNGTTTRLVLIVDVWHPELTEDEKKTMPAI